MGPITLLPHLRRWRRRFDCGGSAKLQKHQQPIEKAENIVKAGIEILTICWAALVAGAVFSFITPARKSAGGRAGTIVSSLYLSLSRYS